MRPGPAAVLDANVLFPFQLRNLLLHLAVDGLFEPLWSEQIVDECVRNLRLRAGLTGPQCVHLVGQMRAAFPTRGERVTKARRTGWCCRTRATAT